MKKLIFAAVGIVLIVLIVMLFLRGTCKNDCISNNLDKDAQETCKKNCSPD